MTRNELLAALMAERYAGPVREWRAPGTQQNVERDRIRRVEDAMAEQQENLA